MRHRFLSWMAIGWAVVFVPAASAHYNMLLPQSAFARRGQAVTLMYQWGHPFEHQLFDAPPPQKLTVFGPDSRSTDWTDRLEKTSVNSGGKRFVAYRLKFTPRERGDFVFLLQTPPIWMEEEQEYFQDVVKVVLHVQVQRGWDQRSGEAFEMVPLTRPYGLQAGTVFQAQVTSSGKPAAGTLVEIERYNAEPPSKLPPDEFVTRTARTDPNGVVTTTFPEAGWWAITANRSAGQRSHQGHMYPVLQRTTLWVPVASALDADKK